MVNKKDAWNLETAGDSLIRVDAFNEKKCTLVLVSMQCRSLVDLGHC